jgi:mannose-1-phosphate guanylyltransferase
MFLFKASRYLKELKKHHPDIYEACQLSMEGFGVAKYRDDGAHVCRLVLAYENRSQGG